MPDYKISISTPADITGLNEVYAKLEAIHNLAKEINKTGVVPPKVGGNYGGTGTGVGNIEGPAPAPSTAQEIVGQAPSSSPTDAFWSRAGGPRTKQDQPTQEIMERSADKAQTVVAGGAGRTSGAASSLPTAPEEIRWAETILPEAMPAITQAIRTGSESMGGGTGAGAWTVPGGRGKNPQFITRPGTFNIPGQGTILSPMGSQERADQWIQSAYTQMITGKVPSTDPQIISFMKASQSTNPEDRTSLYQQYAGEANIMPNPDYKPPNPTIPRAEHKLFGGLGTALSAAGEGDIAGAIGGAATSLLPYAGPALLGAAAIGVGVSSFNAYMDSGTALSDLTKQVITVGDAMEDLQKQANAAGAALGYTPDQIAQVLNIIGSSTGQMGTTGLVQAGYSAENFSRAYGVPINSVATYMGQASVMGITSGQGALFSNQGLLNVTGAMSDPSSGMQGRTEQVMDEVAQVAQTIASTAVIIPNQMGMMAGIAAMNASGVRGLQGTAGGQILSTASQGIANANGPLGNYAELQAFSNAGFQGNYLEMKMQADQGAFGLLPNGETDITAIMDYYKGKFPGADLNAPVGSKAHQEAAGMVTLLGQMNLGLNPLQTSQLVQTDLSDPTKLAAREAQLQVAAGGPAAPPNLTNTQKIDIAKAEISATEVTVVGNIATGVVKHGDDWNTKLDPMTLAPEGTYQPYFQAAAQVTGMDPLLLQAIATHESGMNATAGTITGAYGLMQLEPATSSSAQWYKDLDRSDIASNVMGGAKLLEEGFDTTGSETGALEEYYAGPNGVAYPNRLPFDPTTGAVYPGNTLTPAEYAEKMELAVDKFSQQVDKIAAAKSTAPSTPSAPTPPLKGVNTKQSAWLKWGPIN